MDADWNISYFDNLGIPPYIEREWLAFMSGTLGYLYFVNIHDYIHVDWQLYGASVLYFPYWCAIFALSPRSTGLQR